MQSPQAALAPKALFIRNFPVALKRDLTRAATINGETFREAVIRACEVELQKLNRKISKASLAIAMAECRNEQRKTNSDNKRKNNAD